MKNLEQVKEILLQQMQVLRGALPNAKDRLELSPDDVIDICELNVRSAEAYTEACRIQLEAECPMQNYISSAELVGRDETAE